MNLGGIVLVVLTIILAVGFAAGVYTLLARDRARAKTHRVWLEDREEHIPGDELPPRDDAWKPAVWYSEAAQGTLFPNQPSPSFRISADSSFQRAITQRELEDLVAGGPTEPQLALPGQTSAPTDQTAPLSIPEDVEALSGVPTVMMKIIPVKDDLPITVKARAVQRNRQTPPLPESELHTNGTTPAIGKMPAEMAEMKAIPLPPLEVSPVYEPIPDEVAPEDLLPVDWAATTVLVTEDEEESREGGFHLQDDQQPSLDGLPTNIFAVAESTVEEVSGEDPHPILTASVGEYPDPGLTWMPMDETAPAEVDQSPEPDTYRPVETDEQRYVRLLVGAYSQAIQLIYESELDVIAVRFTNCPVMESTDVPWVFQTISEKIQALFASDTWQQHGLLLDVAGLLVAPEAEAAWEMVLDGFVTQLCPEVAPRIALAIQYDSSAKRDSDGEAGTAPELQRASSVTGQPRPLVVARSYDAALLLLQLMRREI